MSEAIIRRIQPEDMDQWFKLRLASLNDAPSAFAASAEEERAAGI